MISQPSLWPFFTFYGGKWRVSPRYPQPEFKTIIEPFAGSAGYSLRNPDRDVILIEKDEVISGLWKWLISVKEKEIRNLPFIKDEQTVNNLKISQEAKWLIGFWLNKGCGGPCLRPSKWMRDGLRPKSFWGQEIRDRIANQLEFIRHWKIINGNYSGIQNRKATWFIDPPYQVAGKYKCGAKDINYAVLADWCRSKKRSSFGL